MVEGDFGLVEGRAPFVDVFASSVAVEVDGSAAGGAEALVSRPEVLVSRPEVFDAVRGIRVVEPDAVFLRAVVVFDAGFADLADFSAITFPLPGSK
ncbi:MAG: hypothetical protein ABIG03_00155 [Candidatus Eisenbacteria bacterium]